MEVEAVFQAEAGILAWKLRFLLNKDQYVCSIFTLDITQSFIIIIIIIILFFFIINFFFQFLLLIYLLPLKFRVIKKRWVEARLFRMKLVMPILN